MSVNGMGEAIAHGGRLAQACRSFPRAPEPFIDLSTGVDPVPYEMPRLPDTCFTREPEPEDVEMLLEMHPTWLRFGQPAGAQEWERLRAALLPPPR